MVSLPRFEPTSSAAAIPRVARMKTCFTTDQQAEPWPARAMAISQVLLGHLLMPRAPIVVAGWNTRVKDVPTDLLVPVTFRCELEFTATATSEKSH